MNSKELVTRIEQALGSPGSQPEAVAGGDRPPQVADHELLRRIGSGSYGEVWLARSITGRWRAVKVVSRSRFESDRPYEREFRGVVQFEPISRSHSGLIQVLHVGRDDSVDAFYYVMELADPETDAGPAERAADDSSAPYRPRTLRSELDVRGRLPVTEVVALGVQLTGALGHVHRHGLLHRDVKPSNVIFVHSQPKLADLGLVATTDEARSFVGTEGFIPPEGPGTVKADLFALGRLLYEAATGKDRCEFPELPSDLDGWPDREAFLELNAILHRLCAPEPERRFANAAEVAGDLNLILAGRSIRRAYGAERRWRQATRVSAVALGLVAIAVALVWFQQGRQRRAETRAAEERTLRERAEGAEHEARQQLYAALLEQARATVRSGELGQRVRALEAIRRAAMIRNTPELRREAIAALALPDLRPGSTLPFDFAFTVRQMDPRFERFAVAQGRGPVQLRRVADPAELATLPAATNLMCYNLTWSRDGRFLAVKRDHDQGSGGAVVEVWSLDHEPRLVRLVRDARRNVRDFHPRLPRLLTSDAEGRVVTWDLETGSERSRRILGEPDPELVLHSPDGGRLAVLHPGSERSLVTIHDAETGDPLFTRSVDASVFTVAWHPAGDRLAVTDRRGDIRLLEVSTGQVQTLGRHRAEAVTAIFDRSGRYLFTGGWERSMICWDVIGGQRAYIIELDGYHLQMRADADACALLTPTGIRLLNLEYPLPRRFPEDLGPRLRLAAFSPEGRWLAASADQRLGVWDLHHPGPAALEPAGAEASPGWTPDGRELFASLRDERCLRWRVSPGESPDLGPRLEPQPLPHPPGFTWLSLASNAVVWTTSRGSQIASLDATHLADSAWKPTARGMSGVSPDLRWLGVYRGYTPDLHIYRQPDLEPVTKLTARAAIAGFQFSPAGDEIAVASRGHVEFWSTETWRPTRVLTNGTLPYIGLLAHPDGHGWWLARDEQRFACLHEARSLEPLLPLPSAVSPLAVSADSRFLAVGVEARRLEVWDLVETRSRLRELGLDWIVPAR